MVFWDIVLLWPLHGLLLLVPAILLGMVMGVTTQFIVKTYLLRARLQWWVGHKFRDWDSASRWLKRTDHSTLEELAGLEDDSVWTPNSNGGVYWNDEA